MQRRHTLKKPLANPRAKRPRAIEAVVVKNGYLNKKIASERIAEFDYRERKMRSNVSRRGAAQGGSPEARADVTARRGKAGLLLLHH